MQGIFQKENTDKALKYGIYRHLPTYEKIIRNLVSFSLKHFGDSVVTFKKPIFSIKSSLFFHYISFIYHHKKKRLTEVSQLLKLRFRILTLNKITNI